LALFVLCNGLGIAVAFALFLAEVVEQAETEGAPGCENKKGH
jgi:hypothetical protein